MAQQLKMLAEKHDDPNLMLATHMVVRENQVSKVILRPSCSRRDTRAHTHKQTSAVPDVKTKKAVFMYCSQTSQ